MRLILEITKQEHIEPFLKWRLEPNTLRFNPVNKAISNDEIREKMLVSAKSFDEMSEKKNIRFFARCGDTVVGSVGTTIVNSMMNTAEIGYFVAQEHQGKGYGFLMVRAFVDKVFKESSIRKLIATVAEENVASRRILEKVGFVQEGLMREHFLINGIPTNEAAYGLLRSEWKSF